MANLKNSNQAWQRAWRIGKLGFGISSSYLGYQFQRLFLDEVASQQHRSKLYRRHAKRAREELQELKGPLMKLGQILSMQGHAFPPEVLEELASLQMSAPSMHPTLARNQFKKALGQYPEQAFKKFEMEPFAAASLGQVHRAISKEGEELAVKIQYPAIRLVIENDMKLIRKLLYPARRLKQVHDTSIEEVEKSLLEECDYLVEASNIKSFRRGLKSFDYVDLPQVKSEFTREKVLTMSFVKGQHLDQLIKTNLSQTQQNRIGRRLLELFYFQLCQMHAVHTDPHLGNYLFHKDGRIGIVDFGRVKRLSPEWFKLYSWFFLVRCEDDPNLYEQMVKRMYAQYGIEASAKHIELMRTMTQIYNHIYPPAPRSKNQAFDFSDIRFIHEIQKYARDIISSIYVMPDMIFLSHAEGGLYNVLHKLKARVPTSNIVRKYV